MAPALAVAKELRDRQARVSFVTTPSQRPLLADAYPAYELAMRGFERRLLARQNLRTIGQLAAASPRAWSILGKVRPAVVLGGGGYVSGPVAGLAALRRIPTVVLEADSHLGVTNRILAPYVRRLFLSFPIEGLEPPKYVVTGRPLSRQQVEAQAAEGREAFGLRPDLPTLLVFGGSQGARTLNQAALGAFAKPDLDIQLVHVCGSRNHDEVEAALAASGAPQDRYRLLAYTDRLAEAMAAADLVVGRSGGSVAEIAALGRPAILVPYPYASADHQRKNALWMANAGAAVIVDDAQLTAERLRGLVDDVLGDEPRRAAMAAASAALGRPRATQDVVDEIERMLAQGGRP